MKEFGSSLPAPCRVTVVFMCVQEEGEVENELLAKGPHYLEKPWVVWYDNSLEGGQRGGAKDWAKSMKRIASFNSIEEFWVSTAIVMQE